MVTKKSPFAKKNAFFSQWLRKTTLLNFIVTVVEESLGRNF